MEVRTVAEPTDDQVWERVQVLMPLCECGEQFCPGGFPAVGHMLVCTACSVFEGVTAEWVGSVVDLARQQLMEEASRG